MTSETRRGRIVHTLFDIGVVIKGIDGVLEIIGGGLLFVVSPARLHDLVRALTLHELSRDPHDVIAGYLLRSSEALTGSAQAFGATYLLWHGVVKVALVTGLLLKQRWAYPVAILAFVLFLLYQLYRYTHTRAPELLVLSVIDLAVIALTWLEYRRLGAVHGFREAHEAPRG